MLKVIASYPATVEPVVKDGTHVASLKMDRCVNLVDREGLLRAVQVSLGLKRPAESDDADPSRKKTRR